jgi:carboxyl-terminal processing protease
VYISRKSTPDAHGQEKPLWLRVTKIAGVTLGIMAVFGLGYGLGSGGLKFETVANGSNKSLPNKLDYSSVDQLYSTIKSNYDGKLDEATLIDGLKAGLANATGDPYTVYFNAKQASDFNKQLAGTFSGVGAELGQDTAGNLIIVAPIEGTPASKAGLRPQDVIAAIDGKTTSGMSVDEAVSKIRGKKGTDVTLRVIRNKTDDLTVKITRDDIKIPSVKSQILDDNIGYLEINQFSDDTARLAQDAANDFKSKGVKGVILDLRGNPGGLVSAATSVSSMWLPEGKTIMQERRGDKAVSTELANGNNILAGVPTVVLIDAGSASASEITAGALKDNGVATLIGVKSFGKGSVQQIINLSGSEADGAGPEVKVTIARWYRPNGQNIDKKGVNPDKEVKMTDDDYKQKRDPQKDAAIEFLKNR